MMAADYRHIGRRENRLGRHYSRFSAFWPATLLAAQRLAGRKSPNAGSNRRRRASAARNAGKAGVVTGAAQGIGKAVALRLAAEGGAVALVDRSVLADEVHTEIEAQGGTAVTVIADLETYAGAVAAMRAARERFGRIDLLVNNVGGTIWAMPYAEYGEAQIEVEIRRSLFPTLWCCRAVLPSVLEGGDGVIVNVSSIATRGINRVPYATAKGGVNAITACLAFEYAAHGIRVCGVAPGGIEAPPRHIPRNSGPVSEHDKARRREVMEQTVSSTLMKRLGTPEEEAGRAPACFRRFARAPMGLRAFRSAKSWSKIW